MAENFKTGDHVKQLGDAYTNTRYGKVVAVASGPVPMIRVEWFGQVCKFAGWERQCDVIPIDGQLR